MSYVWILLEDEEHESTKVLGVYATRKALEYGLLMLHADVGQLTRGEWLLPSQVELEPGMAWLERRKWEEGRLGSDFLNEAYVMVDTPNLHYIAERMSVLEREE